MSRHQHATIARSSTERPSDEAQQRRRQDLNASPERQARPTGESKQAGTLNLQAIVHQINVDRAMWASVQ